MTGWTGYKLADLTTKIGSGATPKGGKNAYKEEGISLFRSLNVHDGQFREKDLAFIDDNQAEKLSNVVVEEGDVLLNITGASIARCCVAPSQYLPARVNQHVSILRPKQDELDPIFLSHLLVSKEYKDRLLNQGEKAGATRQALTKAQLQNFTIAIPPLPEQQRIVAILDDAFERIDAAIANTEKNLANARELFESYLNEVFARKGEGWVTAPIENCFKVKSGDFLPKKKMVLSGCYEVYGGNGPAGNHDKFNLERDNIVIGRVGAKCGNIHVTNSKIWLTDNAFFVSNYYRDFDTNFLALLLQKANLGSTANQAAQPVISYKTIKPLILKYPESTDVQKEIVDRCQEIQDMTSSLEFQYQKKLTLLTELKQSILQKAFAGELTADMDQEALAI
jgi:type I restriction enzyme S subunit